MYHTKGRIGPKRITKYFHTALPATVHTLISSRCIMHSLAHQSKGLFCYFAHLPLRGTAPETAAHDGPLHCGAIPE